MSGNNGFVDVGDMIHQIGDLCSVLVRQTIPRGVGDIDDGGAGFDHCFYYPGQLFFFCTACIFGVGSTKRLTAVRWGVAGHLIIAWVLTIPASGLLAACSFFLLNAVGFA